MRHADLGKEIVFDDESVVISALYETAYCKEYRIAMQRNQVMRDHESAFPLVLYVYKGLVKITFNGKIETIGEGELLSFDAQTTHQLEALEDTVLRLTIFCTQTPVLEEGAQ